MKYVIWKYSWWHLHCRICSTRIHTTKRESSNLTGWETIFWSMDKSTDWNFWKGEREKHLSYIKFFSFSPETPHYPPPKKPKPNWKPVFCKGWMQKLAQMSVVFLLPAALTLNHVKKFQWQRAVKSQTLVVSAKIKNSQGFLKGDSKVQIQNLQKELLKW